MKGERRCRSPNHGPEADKAMRFGSATRFKCPRCRRWFCSHCEGTDDGFKTCDVCWKFIIDRRGPDEGAPSPTFVRMVKRYAYRIAWPELLGSGEGRP